MAYTISFQNRPQANRDHNIRNTKITQKEQHIDPKGHYEIWHDETLRDAYNRIFGAAVEEYNAKQTRTDRKILDYLKKIKDNNLKNPKKPVYECIVQVGNRDNQPPEEVSRAILRQFYEDWEKSNPQLEIIGAYYHADEPNGTPHMHIDYVPVGEGYKRGLRKQNSLSKALEMQGFKDMRKVNNKTLTPQQQWQYKEVARLEALCISDRFDIEVFHPQREHREHLSKQDYILQQQIAQKEQELQQLQQLHNSLINQIGEQEEELLANTILLQGQPHDLETRLNAEKWQLSEPILQDLKFKSGQSLYDYIKSQHPEQFRPWKQRKDLTHDKDNKDTHTDYDER